MTYHLGGVSERRLVGVNDDLVAIVRRAISITSQDFTVLEGVRTLERQKQLKASGASRTLKSKHLTGHAVDLAPYPVAHPKDWSRPEQLRRFQAVGHAMRVAAADLDIPLVWGAKKSYGGHWSTFNDMPHFQISP